LNKGAQGGVKISNSNKRFNLFQAGVVFYFDLNSVHGANIITPNMRYIQYTMQVAFLCSARDGPLYRLGNFSEQYIYIFSASGTAGFSSIGSMLLFLSFLCTIFFVTLACAGIFLGS